VEASTLPPAPHAGTTSVGAFTELVVQLARREIASRDRFTVLGSLWPLVRQLAQLGVLVFTFSKVLPLHIENYPAFVFTGLIAWTWFTTGITGAAYSILTSRHLVFQSRFPTPVLPAVSIMVPLLDVLVALPLLLVLVAANGDLSATALYVPLIAAVQIVLMCGIAWFVAAANVYYRDVGNIVSLVLLLAFYTTPIFYDSARVPDNLQWVINLNPMTTLIEAYRAVLLDGTDPFSVRFGVIALVSVVLTVTGYLFFPRVKPGFVDEL